METQVRTPQLVFMQPQRLIVPLFQRPYVWSQDNQWEPLWQDLERVARRLLNDPHATHQPHFLGAVVVQQVQNPTGSMQERTIIDGQQRLTTLQLLLDALHAELLRVGAEQPAARIEPLITNPAAFRTHAEDRFKVWPTNRDRPAFNAVMAAAPPVRYAQLGVHRSRLVDAHEYFTGCVTRWLQAGAGVEDVQERAQAVERAVRELMQLVVIDLNAEENAQEIFETLNARGAQLTAADLIKNFVFQRLSETGADVEAAYEKYWAEFETPFWETEISAGRVLYQRSSMFLNHWLTAKTGEEVLAREVFARFKRYADYDSGLSITDLLGQIHRAGHVYRDFIQSGQRHAGPLSRTGLFSYRTGVLESEVVKPLVMSLLDPDDTPVPQSQVDKALSVVESWLVRRTLVRATSKSYTQVVAELISHVASTGRHQAGDAIEWYLRMQTGSNWYWPDDDEVRASVRTLAAYRRLSRGRMRMVLEAVEDYLRGWRDNQDALGGERVARGKYVIEHVLPRQWHTPHWTLGGVIPSERDALVDTIGNLTLLTHKLNSKVSNGPWLGHPGKRAALEEHDVLMLNRRLVESAPDGWDDEKIRRRTEALLDAILAVWPVPAGHRSVVQVERRAQQNLSLSDLMRAGLLETGATLTAAGSKHAHTTATVLADGGLEVNGRSYASPSGAASAVTGHAVNGWTFWVVDAHTGKTLRHLAWDMNA